ncbi:pantoate--beta-alanine ligase [Actinoallomurus vinaceus]|uniref:Pantothenate synthetase n=1 Tax=Actinoallomurus vinaceus TaxID=1080074 RepID=A0ABP8UFM5_9ACTN
MSASGKPWSPLLIDRIDRLSRVRENWWADGRRVALVPTMGALHDGHRALIRTARRLGEAVVVTIFVNPLQFLPGEDFDRYPRRLEADLRTCAAEHADLVFAPSRSEIYPADPEVTVCAGAMGRVLEGATRPGHFDGMLTVVLKLLHLVRPDIAVFGEKDGQQLALIRKMVTDLDVPVRIQSEPTVRDSDGLALSSRNAYLSDAERSSARALPRALFAGRDAAGGGRDAVLRAGRKALDDGAAASPPVELDYLTLVSPDTWTEIPPGMTGPAILAVAAKVGDTRLIDNLPLVLGPE